MSKRLRIAFFGTPEFAVPTLTRLLDSDHSVVAVVTQPDRPRGRGHRVTDAPVKALARARNVEVLQPERLARDLFDASFRELDTDLGVVAAYGKLLPEWLLQTPRLGMINVHASLLPRWRGASPIQRAVLAGDVETGVTIMRVVKALDAGPMLAKVRRPIGFDESSDQVEGALAQLGADLLRQVVDQLSVGHLVGSPQDEAAVTYAPRLTKEEGKIDWARPAIELHNHVRGMRPWPSAYTFLEGARFMVHGARPGTASSDAPAGICINASSAISIACGDGQTLDLLHVQLEGRRAVSAQEFIAGHQSLLGRRFE